MGSLADQVMVVTGASSGIGRATALEAARRGATLALVARSAEALAEAADDCRAEGVDVSTFAVDVSDPDEMVRVADEVVGAHGRIDTWVNNAAVHLFAPLEQAPVEDWHRVIEVNVNGTYHGMRAALGWMREQGRGTIVNVSSVLGRVGAPHQSAYVASKHAIRGLGECARQELSDLPDVHVCTVMPGPIDTPLFEHAANYTGRAIKPLSPVIDARRVAKVIVGCATRPRDEVAVGATPKVAVVAARLVPGMTARVSGRQVEQDHFAPAPAPASHGNLSEPMPDTDAVSGGWARSGELTDDGKGVSAAEGHRAGRFALVGALAAVIALAGVIGARKRGG
jgi:NAD(P)-dependent dehydrogenase (short-subunit alcohol dehydrogenase family)